MNLKHYAAATLLILASQAHAAPVTSDPCVSPSVAPNNWLISVNENDAATREGLLKTIDLLATGGFTLQNVFAYESTITPAKTFVVTFDPTYWGDAGRATQVKNQMLAAISAIPGNGIECNAYVYPAPAIGVRN